jgi:hypothetical protein
VVVLVAKIPLLQTLRRSNVLANIIYRPTGDKPVYCCVNISGRTVFTGRRYASMHCVMSWSQAMLADDEEKTTAGTRRRTTRSD